MNVCLKPYRQMYCYFSISCCRIVFTGISEPGSISYSPGKISRVEMPVNEPATLRLVVRLAGHLTAINMRRIISDDNATMLENNGFHGDLIE